MGLNHVTDIVEPSESAERFCSACLIGAEKRNRRRMQATGLVCRHRVPNQAMKREGYMAPNNPEAVDLKELDRSSQAGEDPQANLWRQAWEGMKASQKDGSASAQDAAQPGKDNGRTAGDAGWVKTNERGGVIARDEHGRITRVDYPDGVTYEYSKFDGKGQPTVMKITDHKDGDFGQWKKEGDGLWRSYNKDKPNYEVLVGEWRVDKQGIMRMDGVQDSRPLPGPDNKGYTEQPSAKITRDARGRISIVDQPNGVTYQYSGFDEGGQPTFIKITQRGSKDFGEWKKERDGLWRAYHNGKPTSEVIVGEWLVNEKGELRHTGHQNIQPVQKTERVSHAARDTARSGDNSGEAKPEQLKVEEFPDGNLTHVKVPDGTVYKRTDGKIWTNSKTGESFQAKVEGVQPGNWYKIERNGKKTTMWTDGSISQEDLSTKKYSLLLPNGTARVFNDGQTSTPARVITPQGREVVFAADNSHSTYEVKAGDTLGRIARDLLAANNTLDQNYKPTVKEIDEAIELLIKTNGITNRNRIEKGQKLRIPKQLDS